MRRLLLDRRMQGGVALLVLLVGGIVAWNFLKPAPATRADSVAAQAPRTTTPPPTPAPVYSPLTGLASDATAAAQPVIGVMIENLYPNARPQSGLGQAGIVYEALAEGGITRFLALFQEPLPVSLGPVRSLRPYYLDWGLEYGVPVAHAGGSQPALAAIKPLGMKDINALVYDGGYFFRTRDRAAPHNLYTNQTLLAGLDQKLGFATAPTFKPSARKPDAPVSPAPHPTININFSTSHYAVQYRYDAPSNSYARFMGGTPHVDRNTGKPILVKNIVLEFIPVGYSTQPDGKPETDYNLIGQGKAVVFDDGNAIPATWSKTTDASPTAIIGTNGQPIALNRGTTWFEIVQTTTPVTY